MLPNFLVIGAQKSGTSSLHQYLLLHPDVAMCNTKEPEFFVEERNNLMDEDFDGWELYR